MIPELRRSHVLLVGLVWACLAGCGNPASPPPSAVNSATAEAPSAAPTVVPSAEPELMVVAIGDSILNSCPGCTAFVDRFAADLATATGQTVGVRNLSQGGLKVQGLLDELGDGTLIGRAKTLSEADAIVVGIAHNDVPWNVDDDACDGADDLNWSKYTDACIAAEVERLTPTYEAVFEHIAALRAGKPTVLRAINRYNDWTGWPGHPEAATAGVAESTAVVAAWNTMICGAAEANGFTCADISSAFNGEDGTQPSGELLATDYTHPSNKGNEVIADVLAELGFEPLAP